MAKEDKYVEHQVDTDINENLKRDLLKSAVLAGDAKQHVAVSKGKATQLLEENNKDKETLNEEYIAKLRQQFAHKVAADDFSSKLYKSLMMIKDK